MVHTLCWFYRAGIAILVLGVAACAGHKPVLYPNAHLQQVGQDAAQRDIEACRQIAKEAGASAGSGKAGTVAGHTAMGAGAGAASGAVGGAIVGTAGTGAAIRRPVERPSAFSAGFSVPYHRTLLMSS